jgi:hypothetical protein
LDLITKVPFVDRKFHPKHPKFPFHKESSGHPIVIRNSPKDEECRESFFALIDGLGASRSPVNNILKCVIVSVVILAELRIILIKFI